MKPIATDTYNFEGLITQGYTYVDKTEIFYLLKNKKYCEKFLNSGNERLHLLVLILIPRSVQSLSG